MHVSLALLLFYTCMEENIIVCIIYSRKLFFELTKPWFLTVKEKKPKEEWREKSVASSEGLRKKREFSTILLNVHSCFPDFTNRNKREADYSFIKVYIYCCIKSDEHTSMNQKCAFPTIWLPSHHSSWASLLLSPFET